jgi:hypothetical protein
MGSAAHGEAVAVATREGVAPLSDLDLGLFVDTPVAPAERERLRAGVREALAPAVRRAGLTRDPIDLGVFSVRHLPALPLTLELAGLAARPQVLWGDPAALAARRGEPVPRFEPLRLLLNRVVEALVPADGDPEPQLTGPDPVAWGLEPQWGDWVRAHRWGKLVMDLDHARLAAGGVLEPSIERRSRLLAESGPAELRSMREAWRSWRARPAWPPPEVRLPALAEAAGETLRAVVERPGAPAFRPGDPAHWRRLLALETGDRRERARRWWRLLRARPRTVGSGAALRLAVRWAPHAWPASLAALGTTLTWLDAHARAADADPAALRGLLVREVPSCQDLPGDAWSEAWARALAEWVGWVRAAGW